MASQKKRVQKNLRLEDIDENIPLSLCTDTTLSNSLSNSGKTENFPWYRTNVEVCDNTGRVTLTLFDQPSEELLNTSSSDISKLQNEPNYQSKASAIKSFCYH